jgi:hypothetical protein
MDGRENTPKGGAKTSGTGARLPFSGRGGRTLAASSRVYISMHGNDTSAVHPSCVNDLRDGMVIKKDETRITSRVMLFGGPGRCDRAEPTGPAVLFRRRRRSPRLVPSPRKVVCVCLVRQSMRSAASAIPPTAVSC